MSRKKTIMIIDDQPSTTTLLSHFLGNYYHVIVRSRAKEALEDLDKGTQTDAIITDIIMPEMTGIEFLSAYQKQKHTKTAPVIMLSSVETSTEKLKCFKHGAKDYVMKPFNPEELHVRIRNVLNN